MKAVVFTLGCKVNQCESAAVMNGLRETGWEVSDALGFADLYIINTCAVTAEAEKKSRQAIERVSKFNRSAEIIIMGCASEKSPEDFISRDGVTVVVGAKSKDKVLDYINKKGLFIEKKDEYYEKYITSETGRTRAYIKIQDGCDNFCSYCIIPYLRGRSRSRAAENVRKEILSNTKEWVFPTSSEAFRTFPPASASVRSRWVWWTKNCSTQPTNSRILPRIFTFRFNRVRTTC